MDQADVLEEVDSSPLPPSQRSRPSLGLFFQSEDSPDLTELPQETETPAEGLPGDVGSPSDSDWLTDGSEPESADPTSSPSTSASAKPLTKGALRQTFRKGIGIGSVIAHRVAARTEGQQRVGLYIADDEDQAAIGDPLAEIAHRRGGIAGKVSPDTADLIQSMLGVANYFTKQVAAVVAAREYDAQAAGSAPLGGPADV